MNNKKVNCSSKYAKLNLKQKHYSRYFININMNYQHSDRHVILDCSPFDENFETIDRFSNFKLKKDGLLKPIEIENLSSSTNLKSIDFDVNFTY